ncbi:MAG: hypothetical protein ACE5HS_05700 [bacterium]
MSIFKAEQRMPQEQKFHDPSLFYFYYFNRGRVDDSPDVKDKLWNELWKIILRSWQWIHQKAGHSPPACQQPKFDMGLRESLRIVGTDWLKNNSESMSFLIEVRFILDSLFIQFGFWDHRDTALSAFNTLQEAMSEFQIEMNGNQNVLIGDTVCFYAEITNEDENQDLKSMLASASQKQPRTEIVVMKYDWGYLYLPAITNNPMAVLSFRDEKSKESASWFINFILPRIVLMHLKIEQEFQKYEEERAEIEKAEYDLKKQLKGSEKSGKLKKLEKRIVALSERQDTLIEWIGKLRQTIIGMETNLNNIHKILQEPVIQGKYQQWWSLFGAGPALAVEQMKVDLNYFNSSNDEALLTLQTLHSFVDIERGKNERRLVGILGIVGMVLAVIDGFSEELTFNLKIIILSIGILMGSIIFLWRKPPNFSLFKRKKTDHNNEKMKP